MMTVLRTAIAVWMCFSGAVYADSTARLAGRVTSGGTPLAGATVLVNRAWPIDGLAYYCPGCYRDCGKSARADAEGRWSIAELDDTLKFELLIVAEGHVPYVTGVVNPARESSVEAALTSRDEASIARERVVRGRVLTLEGKPVKHAVVSPRMVYTPESGRGGAVEGLDPLAVTDEEGRFSLVYTKACVAMDLEVAARGHAVTCFPGRSSGGREHELRVGEGGMVTGRLVRDGAPVRDVEMTLAVDQSGRRVCFDAQTLATDENGRFVFTGVLPGQGYVLTASVEQLEKGCVAPARLRVDTEGEEVDAGDVSVIAGVRISGRVLAPKDRALPEGAKISLSSAHGWDGVTVNLGPEGAFMFPEIAPGEVSLSLHAPGVYISHRNPSADKLNVNRMVGMVMTNITGMEIETTTQEPARPSRRDPEHLPELGGVERPRK